MALIRAAGVYRGMSLAMLLLPPIAAGAAAGLVAVVGLLAEDRYGLAGMMLRDPLGYLAFALLALAFIGTFAAAALGATLGASQADD